jgi:very-short-patch-repair endonuclease
LPRGFTEPRLWLKLKPLARQKRHAPTPEEDRLWQSLRDRQLAGVKFRRQYSIERFIVDFASVKHRLVIEIDGPIHEYTEEEDAIRQELIEAMGFRVLRFTNDEVDRSLPDVLKRIAQEIHCPDSRK